ncbi:MAG: universal stress protein [Streptosporangiales bacterium]
MWRRVVVGVDGSLGSLSALRQAVAIAQQEGASLHVVWVCQQVVGHVSVAASMPHNPMVVADGRRRIADAFDCSLGGYPADVAVKADVRAYEGNPGRALVEIAGRADDLLVVGAGTRRWLHRGQSVSRYCLRYARCPVLVAPPSELARAVSHHLGWSRKISHRLLRVVADPEP